jgi:chromatin segregation and condensation protein Rec8/ScpA/Scc1 (kleisin family)
MQIKAKVLLPSVNEKDSDGTDYFSDRLKSRLFEYHGNVKKL